jgi:Xaa-Pro aminopeptidase
VNQEPTTDKDTPSEAIVEAASEGISDDLPALDPRLAPTHPALHASNRARLLDRLEDGEGLLLFASPTHIRSQDAEYRYRQHSDVIWLTGWRDPDCAVLVRKGAEQPFVMFVQPKNEEREVWTGRRPGPRGAEALYGADAAFEFDELEQQLVGMLQGIGMLHYRFADDAGQDKLLMRAIHKAKRAARRSGLDVPLVFTDTEVVLHELRLHKSPAEIALLKRAAAITGEAHVAAMTAAEPGMHEYEVEAIIDGMFRRRGGWGAGYTTIVGGGENATILHYVVNDQPLEAGTLVCVDAGCELDGYTADVTRTWPVDGVFTDAQRELYQAVLDAEVAAIEACVVGNTHHGVHEFTTRLLTRSMCRLGLLDGDPDDDACIDKLIEDGAQKRYFMHGTGHWLGLDVHDVGSYAGGGESKTLSTGMVLTIEPGLYVSPTDEQAPERFRGIGIRIEDDILISTDGPVNLTAAIPKTIDDVEAACRGGR